ncbi:DUF3789 domain-containing protein [Porcipelethomonas sp.]|uniref:DUF3789 domain-containing protein n=1 Tax=Porcipelethomonas sp. TaxID=2981675 RepID=UPI00307AB608
MRIKRTDNNMNGGEIMLGFILGSLFGGTVGVFTMLLCNAAKRADEKEEDFREFNKSNH